MIKVQHLDKHFNRGKKNSIHVLNDVSLTFPEKGLVVLLGPSGSGKTTLLNVIGGLDKVQKGQIKFFDHEINHYKSNVWDKIRTEEVGYVFQNYYLMPNLSVFDNVAFVLKMIGINDKKEIDTRVNYILKQVGMYRFRKKKSTQLSGGQQQRVAIARALVKNPKVIIADEPTGNLDSKNTLDIMNIIKSISTNKLVVLVTHERDLANFYGDRIVEIKDGQIIGDNQNEAALDHDFSSDNVIYLKDLEKLSDFSSDTLKASLYTDADEVTTANVRLIIKNKTLYLDVQSDIQKIKLIGEDSHMDVKDEHFTKKSRSEMLETTFDDSILEHSQLQKQKRLTISFKNSFWIAFRKLMNFGRKGKLMLAIFMISGMLVAFATINMYSILTKSYKDMLSMDERYIVVEKDSSYSNLGGMNAFLTSLNQETSGDHMLYMDRKTVPNSLRIDLGHDTYKDLNGPIKVEYVEQLETKDLYAGRLPVHAHEVVISYGVYSEGSMMDLSYQDVGIWHASDLIGEKLTFDYINVLNAPPYEIVGIADFKYKSIYALDYETAFILVNNDVNNLDNYTQKSDYEVEIISNNGLTSSNIHIYTPNYLDLLDTLATLGYRVQLSSQEVMDNNNIEIARQVATNTLITIFLISGGLLAFYFVMRSSMISRIYEISVYRALGIRKTEIYGSFSVEIILLTSVSSLIGFGLMSLVLGSLSSSPLGSFANFRVDFIIVLLGILFVYVANLVIGLLPLMLLLRRTPAQIISSYDI